LLNAPWSYEEKKFRGSGSYIVQDFGTYHSSIFSPPSSEVNGHVMKSYSLDTATLIPNVILFLFIGLFSFFCIRKLKKVKIQEKVKPLESENIDPELLKVKNKKKKKKYLKRLICFIGIILIAFICYLLWTYVFLHAGSIRTVNGLEMIYCPKGSFMMGAVDYDTAAEEDEKPQHQVKVNAFWISREAINVKLFRDFVNNTGYKTTAEIRGTSNTFNEGTKKFEVIKGLNWKEPGTTQSEISPVSHISWYDAIEFCNYQSIKNGLVPYYTIDKMKKDTKNISETDNFKWVVSENKNSNGFRLPDESEHEYAYRAGSKTIFPWGDSSDVKNSNNWSLSISSISLLCNNWYSEKSYFFGNRTEENGFRYKARRSDVNRSSDRLFGSPEFSCEYNGIHVICPVIR
jgi:formylglycine-generating enzyme required for sulfatase activity